MCRSRSSASCCTRQIHFAESIWISFPAMQHTKRAILAECDRVMLNSRAGDFTLASSNKQTPVCIGRAHPMKFSSMHLVTPNRKTMMFKPQHRGPVGCRECLVSSIVSAYDLELRVSEQLGGFVAVFASRTNGCDCV